MASAGWMSADAARELAARFLRARLAWRALVARARRPLEQLLVLLPLLCRVQIVPLLQEALMGEVSRRICLLHFLSCQFGDHAHDLEQLM